MSPMKTLKFTVGNWVENKDHWNINCSLGLCRSCYFKSVEQFCPCTDNNLHLSKHAGHFLPSHVQNQDNDKRKDLMESSKGNLTSLLVV